MGFFIVGEALAGGCVRVVVEVGSGVGTTVGCSEGISTDSSRSSARGLTQRQMVVWSASRPRSRSSSSTSRNESEDRRYQRTAHSLNNIRRTYIGQPNRAASYYDHDTVGSRVDHGAENLVTDGPRDLDPAEARKLEH